MQSTSATTSASAGAPSGDVLAEIDSEESSFDDEDQETTEERDTTTASEASSSAVVSLLERLKAPKKSDLTSERVFSLLKASFGPQQDCSLQESSNKR